MNHVEVLKEMAKLGSEDDRFLVPALFNLTKGGCGKINPFYPNHQSMPKNVVRMIQVNALLQDLRDHNYNIYECGFLDSGRQTLRATCAFSIVVQLLLFVILAMHNLSGIMNSITEGVDSLNHDATVVIVAIVTTVFFAKLAYAQCKSAFDFNNIFSIVGDRSPYCKALLFVNIAINGGLGALITIFNFFFLLVSNDANEAILNSLALYFILEMDDTLKPDWDDVRIEDEIGINIHDYIMDGEESVQVTMVNGEAIYNEDDELSLLEGDDKVYVETDRLRDLINVFWRRSPSKYQKIEFHVDGKDKDDFLDNVEKFYCLGHFRDIHD